MLFDRVVEDSDEQKQDEIVFCTRICCFISTMMAKASRGMNTDGCRHT